MNADVDAEAKRGGAAALCHRSPKSSQRAMVLMDSTAKAQGNFLIHGFHEATRNKKRQNLFCGNWQN
jgi:hypothetical protein